jgi:hypothetical protein
MNKRPEGFDRKPLSSGGRLLVESTCRICGTKLVGNVFDDTLTEVEVEHWRKCPHHQKAPSNKT